ncbi:MAG: hypothetical protein ACE5HT_12605 [Gemmatimonadales bacterium]
MSSRPVVDVVTRDERGWYFIAAGRELRVFDERGNIVKSISADTVGSSDYRAIVSVVSTGGGTMQVFDAQLQRVTLLSPTLTVTDRVRLPVIPLQDVVLLDSIGWVLNADSRTTDRIGLPLHMVDRNGKWKRSFGSTTASYRPGTEAWPMLRKVADAGGGRLWMAHLKKYVVELWDTGGTKHKELVRHVPWFRAWQKYSGFFPDVKPHPIIRDIRQDREGRLWVVIAVPDERWSEALTPVKYPDGTEGYEPQDWNSVFDTVIEVLEPATGRLIVSRRFPQFMRKMIDERHLFSDAAIRDGGAALDVWHVTLVMQ